MFQLSSKDRRPECRINGELELRPVHNLGPLREGSRGGKKSTQPHRDTNKNLSWPSLWIWEKLSSIRNWNLRSAFTHMWSRTLHYTFQILNFNIKLEEAHPAPWPCKSIGEKKNVLLKRRLQSNNENPSNTAHSRTRVLNSHYGTKYFRRHGKYA